MAATLEAVAAKTWPPSTPQGRWSTLGPYYAMFPVSFTKHVISHLCPEGGAVLDPFCGRGTVPFVAKATGRRSLGIDLNPVAYVYSSAKIKPAPDEKMLLKRIRRVAASVTDEDREPENEFQDWAWCPAVLGFLNAARRLLDWRNDRVDRTLAAILLVHLHGKLGNAVSNQMRQSKAMAAAYAVNWWKTRGMRPPKIDPVAYFGDKVRWRYGKGIVTGPPSRVLLGDSRTGLAHWRGAPFSMLLTSPPYCGVTNYKVDNWIRLWLLGGSAWPEWEKTQRYENRQAYTSLIHEVFTVARPHLTKDAVIYVRTDSRKFTKETTISALRDLWPDRSIFFRCDRPTKSQTQLFGDRGEKPGEIDLLVLPSRMESPKGYEILPEGLARPALA